MHKKVKINYLLCILLYKLTKTSGLEKLSMEPLDNLRGPQFSLGEILGEILVKVIKLMQNHMNIMCKKFRKFLYIYTYNNILFFHLVQNYNIL